MGKTIDLNEQRKNAKHGDFFFAKFMLSDGTDRKSPVFVLSSEIEVDDDIIICKCTSQPPKSVFDVPVKLKYDTCIRTNKIYLVARKQLLFKIQDTLNTEQYQNVIDKIKLALKLP
jgi:hypothetical protein